MPMQPPMMNRTQPRQAPTGPYAPLVADTQQVVAAAQLAAVNAQQASRGASEAAAQAAVLLLAELLTRLAALVAKHRKDAPAPEPIAEG